MNTWKKLTILAGALVGLGALSAQAGLNHPSLRDDFVKTRGQIGVEIILGGDRGHGHGRDCDRCSRGDRCDRHGRYDRRHDDHGRYDRHPGRRHDDHGRYDRGRHGGNDRFDRDRVRQGHHRDRCCAGGYYKTVKTKRWVPGGWRFSYDSCGNRVRIRTRGYFTWITEKVWVPGHARDCRHG